MSTDVNSNVNTGVNTDSADHTTADSSNLGQKESLRDRVGNVIEKVGHKISEAGAPGIGQAIHDLGDKLEKDHKNVNHPHDV